MIRKLSPEIFLEFKSKIERWQNNPELVSDAIDIDQMVQNLEYYQQHHYPKSDIYIEDAGLQKYSVMLGITDKNKITYTFYSLKQLLEFVERCKVDLNIYKPISNYKFNDLQIVLEHHKQVEKEPCTILHFKNRYSDGFNI